MVVGCDTGGWDVDTDVSEKHTATIFTAEVSVKMKTLFNRGTARCYRAEIRNRNPDEFQQYGGNCVLLTYVTLTSDDKCRVLNPRPTYAFSVCYVRHHYCYS
jgi:hypothetical protein